MIKKLNTKKFGSVKDQYWLLTDLLDNTKWQLEGDCEDIDCNRYIYLDSMKRKSVCTVLDHKFSCVPKLKRDYKSIMGLLSEKKFRKLRYKKCDVCAKLLDTLNNKNPITTFIAKKLSGKGKIKGFECKMFRTHKQCKKMLKVPEGFRRW